MLGNRTLGVSLTLLVVAAACGSSSKGGNTGGATGSGSATTSTASAMGGGPGSSSGMGAGTSGTGAGSTTGAGAGSTTGTGAGNTSGVGAASTTGTGAGSTTSTGTGTGTSSSSGTAGGCPVFLATSPWNTDISTAPTTTAYASAMPAGTHLHPDFGSIYGIPYQYVTNAVTKQSVTFDYADESDPGPYPIPANPVIEDGGDGHMLLVDTSECVLYELYSASQSGGHWNAGSGAIWDLKTNSTRPACWTSADAAGLPIFPGLARYEEAKTGVIDHALRFTMNKVAAAYTAPASHYGGNGATTLPPFGLRMRLKASVDISAATPQAKIVLTALKKYGMFLADIGSDWFIGGAPDMSWDDDDLGYIKGLTGGDFEAVKPGAIVSNCQ